MMPAESLGYDRNELNRLPSIEYIHCPILVHTPAGHSIVPATSN
jgi:hypothetical protein